MSESSEHSDLWHWPTMLLWSVFFLAGLFPENAFYGLRALGQVTPQRALINSYHAVTLGLAAYLYFFTYRRCIEAELTRTEAHGRALQIGIFALLAFLPVSQVVLSYQDIPFTGLRNLVLAVGTAKLAAWIYLYTILVRYYCFDGAGVYRRMRSMFPSTAKVARSRSDVPDADTAEE